MATDTGTESAKLAELLADATYEGASLPGDIVMKGGITSGVTYPWAVCEIAKAYRLRSVGGTSAGAIAAAAAAAAEVGRKAIATAKKSGKPLPEGAAGFARLARLPKRLSSVPPGQRNSVLFNVFQPAETTKPFFRILTAALNAKQGLRKKLLVPVAVLGSAPLAALIGSALGLATLALLVALDVTRASAWSGVLGSVGLVVGLICAILVAILGAVVGVLVRLGTTGLRRIEQNGFGVCKGFIEGRRRASGEGSEDLEETAGGSKVPKPLATWLADEFDALAGRPTDGHPLTLADLAEAGVTLKMFTTNLTEGTPYTMPFFRRGFYFDPSVFRTYFPERVVRCMVDNPPQLEGQDASDYEKAKSVCSTLVPFPDAANLPVVVMTRMSLSFPVLLSAVPLWRVYQDDDTGQGGVKMCWFSDGGITSNFPIHFFDSALPRWPTFGINLGPAGPAGVSSDQRKNIWAPRTNDQGAFPRWSLIRGLGGFGHSITDTMQNWMDNAQAKVPGYRDRIVLVLHTKKEGGMNLNMRDEDIDALAKRGMYAGEFLVNRFSREGSQNERDELSWENHRWIRFRSVLPLIEELMAEVVRGYDWTPWPSAEVYDELIASPASYAAWKDSVQRDRVQQVLAALLTMARDWSEQSKPTQPARGPIDIETLDNPKLDMTPPEGQEPYSTRTPFLWGAPRPRPTIRIVRDF
jgi:predicted acylesterase/phospholipase RssA